MPSLAETQTRLHAAIVEDDAAGLLPLLVGGHEPAKRLAIHQRHYETSLVTALLGKFPAVVWLVGAPFATEAAREFVHRHPPTAPCIAEYGRKFPDLLASRPGAERLPYLRWFGEIEWHLGHVAVAIDRPSLTMDALAALEAAALPDVSLVLQPGLRYLAAPWPVDDLIKVYLSEAAPDHYVFEPAEVQLEIRGARGEFRIDRLEPATFVFRQALAAGHTIGSAAEEALQSDTTFDPGRALAAVLADGLAAAVNLPNQGAGP